MLRSRQWSRAAGFVVILLIVLIHLRSANRVNRYRTTWGSFPGEISKTEAIIPQYLDEKNGPSDGEHTSIKSTAYLDPSETRLTIASPSPAVMPTSAPARKAIVVGKLTSQDTEWIASELPDWTRYIYVVDLPKNVDSPTGLKTRINKAKEAFPYLTFIVEHYDHLPDIAVFIHAHRKGWPAAWHNDSPDHDAVTLLRKLQLPFVQEQGYVNLRCNHIPGCPHEIVLNRQSADPDKDTERAYPQVYGEFFNMSVEDVKAQIPIVAAPCCAQFAVTREQIMKRPRSEYERYLRYIERSTYDDETLGTVMEYIWHIMFGRNPVHCPELRTCYGNVYGRWARVS